MIAHLEVLGRKALLLLPRLGRLLGKDYYLAGGTGLALQAGHRRSEDLDFFIHAVALVLPDKERLKIRLRKLGTFEVRKEDAGTLHLYLGKVQVTFLAYRPKLIEPVLVIEQTRVASPVDIGLMELSAIVDRGSRKDFMDLAWIIRERKSLPDLISLTDRKFTGSHDFKIQVMKALTYFADAETEVSPVVLDPRYQWPPVKKFIQAEVKRMGSKF